jgi:hypothetical protein
LLKLTPSAAIESMCGVGTVPPATPPPLKLRAFQPRSSARIRTTLGGHSPRRAPPRIGAGRRRDVLVGADRDALLDQQTHHRERDLLAPETATPTSSSRSATMPVPHLASRLMPAVVR